MKRYDTSHGIKWTISTPMWIYLWIPIIAISVMHYTTGAAHHWLHDIFRRLYYIPIIIGAFYFGTRGAILASVTASVIYMPHAFTNILQFDPAHSIEKLLEILLYNVIAYITGRLADTQYKTSMKLEDTLEEKRVMERQLIRSGRLQALGELTAGLAHEIKNPLASLKGSAEIIGSEINADSPKRKMVEIHKKELDRLNGLLERFLDFARPAHFNFSEMNICAIIDQTIMLMESHSSKHHVKISWDKPVEPILLNGDREKIIQVVFNLLLNAVQSSSDKQKVYVRCRKTTRIKRDYIFVEIKDEGSGVSEEVKEKIFDPFFTTKGKGSGLGLSIANRIVDEHGGFIEVENPNGGGALFRILLLRS